MLVGPLAKIFGLGAALEASASGAASGESSLPPSVSDFGVGTMLSLSLSASTDFRATIAMPTPVSIGSIHPSAACTATASSPDFSFAAQTT